ncbi:MAG: hypothetical protein DRO88_04800 [Promethearchaeia archaeon]|nr:MAG: hypothetical protein DRO88_04800 [Candidatus Lokiarchaeia archaeon]
MIHNRILIFITLIQIPDITDFLEQIYNAIEIILPYLIPFMNLIQPVISGFGNFLRILVAPLYESFNFSPNYYLERDFLIFYLIGGLILILAIFSAIKWPVQRNSRKNIV